MYKTQQAFGSKSLFVYPKQYSKMHLYREKLCSISHEAVYPKLAKYLSYVYIETNCNESPS